MNVVFSLPIAILSQYIFAPIIFVLSLFMVLLILVQRGKGGGLTGALGGPGGQSAFGTKAGDLFTRITIVTASIWIFLLAFAVWWYTESDFSSVLADTDVTNTPSMGASPKNGMPTPPASAELGGPAVTAEVDKDDLPATTPAEPKMPAEPASPTEPKTDPAPSTAEPKAEPSAKTNEPKSEPEPKAAEPKVEPAPSVDEPKADSPKADSPKADSPKIPSPKIPSPK